MANVLPRTKQLAVLGALVEGCGIRATSRMTGVSIPTVLSLLERVGLGCLVLLDRMMRGLQGTQWQLDEQWDFVQCKQRQVREDHDAATVGDQWTFVALDAESKLVPCFRVGKRTAETTKVFLTDFASRLANRVQISTDGFGAYVEHVPAVFSGEVDFATIVKDYEAEPAGAGRYSPPKVVAVAKTPICGAPVEEDVTTSHVESLNRTTRSQMRRMTRLTNAHSKKLANHVAATALHFFHYDVARIHTTLRVTPGMAAGITDHVWSMDELLDAALAACDAEETAS